jgi:hypothetical protein
MKVDRIALTTLMGVGGQALKKIDAAPQRIGGASITVFSAPAGSGQTTLFEQFGTLHSRAVVTVHSDPSTRTLRNDIYAAVCGDQSCYFGSDGTQRKIIDELKIQGGPVVIFDNADRLANPKLLDVVRDIADSAGCPIVLSCIRGRRGLWEMLRAPQTSLVEAVSSRIEQFVELPALSLADAELLSTELAEIPFDAKVIAHLFKRSGASVRAMLGALCNAEDIAMTSGLDFVGPTEWGVLTGETIEVERSIAPQRKALESPTRTIHQAIVKAAIKAA